MPHNQTRPENPSSTPLRSSSLRCCSLPSVSMDFPHTPRPPAPPTGVDTLLSACLKCASASFLHGGGASLARAAGSSVVGLPRDGGAPTVGGESKFSAHLGPFDSFVDVVLGRFWGVGGDSGSVGFVEAYGDRGLGEHGTILASALGVSSSLFVGPAEAAKRGGIKQRTLLSPLTFQGETQGQVKGGADSGTNLQVFLLGGKPRSKPPLKAKTYRLFKYKPGYEPGVSSTLARADGDTPCWRRFSTQDFCAGLISMGGRFCTKRSCEFQSHRTKACEGGKMYPGFYVHNTAGLKAYLEPFLPMEIGMRTATGRAVLSGGEQTMEAWAAIFRHLCDTVGNGELEKEEGMGASAGAHSKLRRFATAMKTPREQEDFNPLATTPKWLCLGNVSEEDPVSSSGLSSGWDLTTLKYALALVKGELGSKDEDAPYNMVHGGIRALNKSFF